MTQYHVTANAQGGGDGSPSSPWTWDELCAVSGTLLPLDQVEVGPGTYITAATFHATAPEVLVFGADPADRPVIRKSGGTLTLSASHPPVSIFVT